MKPTHWLPALGMTVMTVLATACADQGRQILLSEPSIIVAQGQYFMVGANNRGGLSLLKSPNLRQWTLVSAGDALLSSHPARDGKCLCAPRIIENEGRYVLTYSSEGQLFVAESASPAGPYEPCAGGLQLSKPGTEMHSSLFRDQDGRWYLYHTRWQKQDDMEDNAIWAARWDMEQYNIIDSTLTECIHTTEPWELTYDGMEYGVKTTESPNVLRRDSIYYLFYSANDQRSVDHAVGYATAKSPLGPWEKHAASPVVHLSTTDENGSGSGHFFMGLDRMPYYVCQARRSEDDPATYAVRIIPLKMARHRLTGVFHITAKKPENIIAPLVFGPQESGE